MPRAVSMDSVTRGSIVAVVGQFSTTYYQKLYANMSWLDNLTDDHIRVGVAYGTTTALGTVAPTTLTRFEWTGRGGGKDTVNFDGTEGSMFAVDSTFYFGAVGDYYSDAIETSYTRVTNATNRNLAVKTDARSASTTVPQATLITANTAHLACPFYANVTESTCSVQIQYRLAGSGNPWIDVGAPYAGNNGYNLDSAERDLTGLTAETTYEFRAYITRTTNNERVFEGDIASFTTLASEVTVTSVAATSRTSTTAVLNGTVNNAGTEIASFANPGVRCFFRWDTSSPPGLLETTGTYFSDVAASSSEEFNESLDSLTPNTTYYYRAVAYWTDGVTPRTEVGAILSFTTPLVDGADDMIPIQDFDRKYGVDTTLFFVVPTVGSSDLLYSGAVVWGAGEVKITKVTYDDDKTPTVSGPTDATNVPVQVSGMMYRLDLESTETDCDEMFITLTNAGTSVRDMLLRVRTHLQLGSADIDAATGTRSNTTALKLRGYGSGDGLEAISGATGQDISGVLGSHILAEGSVTSYDGGVPSLTLTDGFVATNDHYNGAVIVLVSGTGAGQARSIVDFTSGGVVTLNKALAVAANGTTDYIIMPSEDVWTASPGVELSTFPTYASSYGKFLQFLFQRFAYKRTQSATVFKMYKDDGSTALTQAGVDDDGVTQTHEEIGAP